VLNPLGYALVGPLSGVFGIPETLFLAAALNAAVGLAVAAAPSIRDLRVAVEPEPAPAPYGAEVPSRP